MKSVDIQPVAESALAMMEGNEEERAFVEQNVQRIAAANNWLARKTLFFDLLGELDATSDLASELAELPELAALMEEAVKQAKAEPLPPEADPPADSPQEDRASPGSDPDAQWEDDLLPDDAFAVVVPVYVGAILERLGEERIECLEQAAIYALSTHDEHQLAAWSWFNTEPKRLRMLRRFMKENPGYRDTLKRVMIADEQFDAAGD